MPTKIISGIGRDVVIKYFWGFLPVILLFIWLVFIVHGYDPLTFHLSSIIKITALAAIATLFLAYKYNRYELKPFLSSFCQKADYFHRPVLNGSVFGLIALIIFYIMFISKNPSTHDTLLSYSFTIYLSTLGLFIALDYFYREHLPITQLDLLVRELTKDIMEYKHKENTHFLYCYPGLSFGSVSLGGSTYDNFFNVIRDFIINGFPDSTIIISDYHSELSFLYKKYEEAINSSTDKNKTDKLDRLNNKAIKDSIELQKLVAKDAEGNASGKTHDSFRRFNREPPYGELRWLYVDTNFNFQAIIIGDIVYIINTFGLPRKIGAEWVNNLDYHNIHVEIVASRIKNRLFANQLREQLIKEAEQYNSHLYPADKIP